MRTLASLSLAALTAAAVVAVACNGTEVVPIRDDEDAAPDAETSPPADATTATDAPPDAPSDAGQGKDANGPGEAGTICSFNRECQAALRCECDESAGCACAPGARGTGRNGLDACDSGDQCASAVCVEGPPDSGYFCSDECGSPADCVVPLPECANIAFVGQICVRTPP